MPFVATPRQMELLKQAVDEYCRDYSVLDGDERLYVAELATSLYPDAASASMISGARWRM